MTTAADCEGLLGRHGARLPDDPDTHPNSFAARGVLRHAGDMAHGTVKFFKPEKGWGAIASPDLTAGCDAWVHFSAIEMDSYRALEAGDQVEFDYEAAQQDSCRFRVTRVRIV